MASPTTPTKSAKTQDVNSPSAKRAADFDFWAARKTKMAKIVEEDLKDFKIKDLSVTRRLDGKIMLRCSALYKFATSGVLKLACDDGENKVAVSAFGNTTEKLDFIKVGDIIEMATFQVRRNEKMEFGTGSFKELEIVVSEVTTLTAAANDDFPPFPYDRKSVLETKSLPDYSVADVLAVVAKNWGMAMTSAGRRKLDVSLTDKTMQTIRFTLWDSDADQLVGKEGCIVAIGRAFVSSYQDIKVLSAKWHTHIETNPMSTDGIELLEWFEGEINQ